MAHVKVIATVNGPGFDIVEWDGRGIGNGPLVSPLLTGLPKHDVLHYMEGHGYERVYNKSDVAWQKKGN